MSWFRSAVSRAVEVGGRNNLTRAVREYAGSVVNHAGSAVAEGARFLQGSRNVQSFKNTVKRLEEDSVSCRGIERVRLLRRWLVALKEVERISAFTIENDSTDNVSPDEYKDSPRPTLVYYYDSDLGSEPRNFRDVFLHSQAIEGITLSMILETPIEEELLLLTELYRICLKEGMDIQNKVVDSIQDLAKSFTGYQDEVLVKREDLLQYAQGAIAGLKLSAEVARIDAETLGLKEKLQEMNAPQLFSSEVDETSSIESGLASTEALEAALAQIQFCSMLELLLLRKKSLRYGVSPEVYTEKVHKLKVLSESLANSSSKAEKRITDNRTQKEEALNFRISKTKEINQAEKEVAAEIVELEKQKDELEAALKKVNSSLSAARQRSQNTKEEREQFDEASNQILVHFKLKEDELSRSILSYRVEADVVNTWIHFLKDTWGLQTSCLVQNEKQLSGELEKYGDYLVNLSIHLLSAYKLGLDTATSSIKRLVEDLGSSPRLGAAASSTLDTNKGIRYWRKMEEEYIDLEAKIVTTLSVVETMKKQFYISSEGIYRKDEQRVKDLFEAIEKIQADFDSMERPVLEIESPTKLRTSLSDIGRHPNGPTTSEDVSESPTNSPTIKKEWNPKMDADLTKLMVELGESDSYGSPKDISDWESDEFLKDFPPMAVTDIAALTSNPKIELPVSKWNEDYRGSGLNIDW